MFKKNAVNVLFMLLLLAPVSFAGDTVEIPSPEDGFRCFCYPTRIVPTVYHPRAKEIKGVLNNSAYKHIKTAPK